MFRNLRLKLTLVNMSIIALLFLLLTTSAYFLVQDRMERNSQLFMERIADDLIRGFPMGPPPLGDPPPVRPLPDAPPPPPPGGPPPDRPHHLGGPLPLVFFVKLDANDNIVSFSPFLSLSDSYLSGLVDESLDTDKERGTMEFRQTEYAFLKAPLPKNQGMFIIYKDLSHDNEALQLMITALSCTGLLCVILSFFGSLLVANKAMHPIQQAWQQQKDFLADASHELRTPLSVIQMNLEAIRANPEEAVYQQAKWLDNISEVTFGMSKLVDSLLFLARVDSRQQLLQKEPFALHQAVGLAASLFLPMAEGKQITLLIQTAEEVRYCGDEAKIRQVVGILLDNAIRHTPENGSISISLTCQQQTAILTVTDTGEGIEDKHLDKIFNRFYQVDSARAKGGTGLGLSIAKWIVESHGGTITATSIPGTATTRDRKSVV